MRSGVWVTLAAVAAGGGAGACCRWLVSEALNRPGAAIPVGTLAVNTAGGYLIGLLSAWILATPGIPAFAKPLLVTGFLGGLTTFSTFSLEAATLLAAGRLGCAALLVASHSAAAIAAVFAGLATWKAIA